MTAHVALGQVRLETLALNKQLQGVGKTSEKMFYDIKTFELLFLIRNLSWSSQVKLPCWHFGIHTG